MDFPQKRPQGRPPMPVGQVRSKRVVTFLTPTQFTQLKEKAGVSGASLSAFTHRLLLSALKTTLAAEPHSQKDEN